MLYNVNFRARQPLFFFFCLFFCAADRQNRRITTPLKRQPKTARISEFRFGQPKRAQITEFRFRQPKRARITKFRFGQPKKAWISEFRFGQPKKAWISEFRFEQPKTARQPKKRLGLLNVAIRTTMGLSRLGLVSANQPELAHNSTSSVACKR